MEFDCILIVAGHRLYKAIPETELKSHLKKCKLIIDNLEETWKHVKTGAQLESSTSLQEIATG